MLRCLTEPSKTYLPHSIKRISFEDVIYWLICLSHKETASFFGIQSSSRLNLVLFQILHGRMWWGEGKKHKMGEESQKVPTSDYEINKSRGRNVAHGDSN